MGEAPTTVDAKDVRLSLDGKPLEGRSFADHYTLNDGEWNTAAAIILRLNRGQPKNGSNYIQAKWGGPRFAWTCYFLVGYSLLLCLASHRAVPSTCSTECTCFIRTFFGKIQQYYILYNSISMYSSYPSSSDLRNEGSARPANYKRLLALQPQFRIVWSEPCVSCILQAVLLLYVGLGRRSKRWRRELFNA